MKFLLLLGGEPEADTWPGGLERFKKKRALIAELEAAGRYVDGAHLGGREEATTVRRRGDDVVVTDGPFSESKEQVGGFFLIDVPTLDDAVAVARRTAMEGPVFVSVRPTLTGAQWRSPARGKDKYMFLLIASPERLASHTREHVIESIDRHYELSLDLAAQGRFVASRSLPDTRGAVRLEPDAHGDLRVVDGPHPESKEVVAGYFIVACDSLDDAHDVARELLFGLDGVEVRRIPDLAALADAVNV